MKHFITTSILFIFYLLFNSFSYINNDINYNNDKDSLALNNKLLELKNNYDDIIFHYNYLLNISKNNLGKIKNKKSQKYRWKQKKLKIKIISYNNSLASEGL